MKVAFYGDVHATKNMRSLQGTWEESVTESINSMYDTFDSKKVDEVICLGDFFDKPVLDARHAHFILPLLKLMNDRKYKTYMLLGNHEAEDEDRNVLSYLREYQNLEPVTSMTALDDLLLLPYDVVVYDIPREDLRDRYVFTHHDIYGSVLAGGKTTACFGIDPTIFDETKRVFNGHVHLISQVTNKVLNAGSLVISQQGELKLDNPYPCYYILDTDTGDLQVYQNKYSMIYLSPQVKDLPGLLDLYKDQVKVFRVEYEGEIPNIDTKDAIISWRKTVGAISGDSSPIITKHSFDFKSYLTEYITNDDTVRDKETYIRTGLEVLG